MSLVSLFAWGLLAAAVGQDQRPFAIEVVDAQTGRGVPLVELRTVNDILLVTDSAGIAAFYEPGLMDQKVFFSVSSHGYQFPADGFGYRGKALAVTPGGHATLKIERQNIAQRLYRVTGEGIYRDSLLVGRPAPIRQPVLDAQVFGSDSVLTAEYRDKIYWFWGDTNRPSYPLGNFKTTGATSELPGHGGLDPEVGVDLNYFTNPAGFVQKMVAGDDRGPTWISGLVVLSDGAGGQRMFAQYANIENTDRGFRTYERGLVEFDDRDSQFKKVAVFPSDGPFPDGAHTLLHADEGTEYVYYCDPYPQIRVPADPAKLAKLDAYEAFTCLAPGSRLKDRRFDRGEDGSLRWAWKADTDPIRPQDQAKLVRSGTIGPEESPWRLADVETGKPVMAHRGTVCWNAYRNRWAMIFCEVHGTSPLGEIWYAEADRLTGPWLHACKIVTHNDYSFYNPKQHHLFDKDGGRVIFFEGTYTRTFSGNPVPTPRYDYNQIMYKLELDDPRLKLPPPRADGSAGSP